MMEFNQILVMLAAFGGLVFGMGLGLIAPEELKPGRKILLYLDKFFLFLAFLPILYYNGATLMVIFPLVLFAALLFLNFKFKIVMTYCVFFLLFYMSLEKNLMVIESAAIFLYGLPAGSLLLMDLFPETVAKLKKKVKIW